MAPFARRVIGGERTAVRAAGDDFLLPYFLLPFRGEKQRTGRDAPDKISRSRSSSFSPAQGGYVRAITRMTPYMRSASAREMS